MPVRDVDAPVSGDGVRRDRLRGGDGVFPRLLHVGVHDQEGVMREVDGDLTCQVGVLVLLGVGGAWGEGGRRRGQDAPDAELAGDAEGERADYWARAEVG